MLNYGDNTDRSSSSCASRSGNRPGRSRTNEIRNVSCSQQSVLTAIDRFVRAVDNMDATVLVPTKLQDIEVQDRRKRALPPAGLQNHQDLYSFYSMLRDVRNELLWGPSSNPNIFPGISSLSSSGLSSPRRVPITTPATQFRQLSFRQSSDDGLGSSLGCSSDQDTDSDFESIMTDRESTIMEQTSHLANAFRHHLHGLHAILHQLADSADYLAARYQDEVEMPLM